MPVITKGIACGVCKNNKDGKCEVGEMGGVNKPDECWKYQHKASNSALATHSQCSQDRRLH